ncbi:ATP-dependent DNA helicase [Microterricola pindariensis]|uniref:ATP-dependent DNA helicase n=1 Tax=Microterricola pindariensis TaxID=478010 RepID=UPI000CEBE848|nr:ATP-dependent DNA helicase [Microterricola pindariensis]
MSGAIDAVLEPVLPANADATPGAGIGAAALAQALELPPPTPEQIAVIEAPPGGQAIVVAGAGSGKTETMANRVVWLLANGHAAVPEVLGLTFTRKAAGELAVRIRERVEQLVQAGIADVSIDIFEAASVSTYNSFASAIYRENAMLIGREPDAVVLGEASAWQLARQVVSDTADPRLVEIDKRLDAVTGGVLSLSRALAENVVDVRDVQAMVRDFTGMADLPIGGTGRKKTPHASFTGALEAVGSLPPLLELAERFQAEKRRRGYVEFSDQVALALEVCERNPAVTAGYRERYKAVLLDEYQDTSVVQTRLLAALFGGHGVMAVGDPDQSIYGWRGASAANLARFSRDFRGAGPQADGSAAPEAERFELSISWRNPRAVLAAANEIVRPFTEQTGEAGEAPPKSPLTAPSFASDGLLDVSFTETVEDEAAAVAEWFAQRLGPGAAKPDGSKRSAAMLCRSLGKVTVFTEALRARGVPFHVLGLAGLLDQPVIVDLVSALRVLHDPSRGSELLRVLAGARWNIGPKDLHALGKLAGELAARDHSLAKLSDEVRARLRGSVADDEGRSIVDALDFLVSARDGHGLVRGFSEVGLQRLKEAGDQLIALRRRAGLELLDLVTLVQQELLLDIEVAANGIRPLGAASLEAFDELVSGFLSASEHSTLGAFLGWLEEAEQRDRLAPRQEEPEPGTVQILTIHGSKGLEWDVVAVPRMVVDEMPGKPRSTLGWLAFAELPFEFKGDAAELPELAWRGVHDQAQFDESVTDFKEQNAAHYAAEQRRLAYVAVTRTKSDLLLSGSWWWSQKGARGPSMFLRELAVAGLINPELLPGSPQEAENPRSENSVPPEWPLHPLGVRGAAVLQAASLTQGAIDSGAGAPIPERLRAEIDALLEERRRRMQGRAALALPTRIPASRFKDFIDDPSAVAEQLRRPMPQRPYRATRLGTLFHSWVEQRSNTVASGDRVDAGLFELEGFDVDSFDADSVAADSLAVGQGGADLGDTEAEQFARLRATFEASPWAGLAPEDVEVEIHLVLDAQVFICKLDAVYRTERGYQIVDWKTGKAPRNAADLALKQTQLALYRLAYSRWKGVPVEQIDAVFYFVADDTVIAPEHLAGEEELLALWAGVTA